MKKVIIPLNAYSNERMTIKEHEVFISAAAKAGAHGVEIRRELLPEGDVSFEDIRQAIENHGLTSVYSAPVEMWNEDGSFNKESIMDVLMEAAEIGSQSVKLPLGHFGQHLSLVDCKSFFNQHLGSIKLLVENDQTLHGGNIERLVNFFENASIHGIPVSMTFDIGNWQYTGEDVNQAKEQLKKHVVYLHLKYVIETENGLETLPLPFDHNAKWRQIMKGFSEDLPAALEFPIHDKELTKSYIDLLNDQKEVKII